MTTSNSSTRGRVKLLHPGDGTKGLYFDNGYLANRAAASLKRELLLSDFSRRAWCLSRPGSGLTTASSPSKCVRSSMGRSEAMIIDTFSQRLIDTSASSSPARAGMAASPFNQFTSESAPAAGTEFGWARRLPPRHQDDVLQQTLESSLRNMSSDDCAISLAVSRSAIGPPGKARSALDARDGLRCAVHIDPHEPSPARRDRQKKSNRMKGWI